MAFIQPFKALRPQPQLAAHVASLPYDVLTSEEAKEVAKNNSYSFLHITKSEIDLPETVEPYSERVYQKAKENLEYFIKQHILQHEAQASYYIYRLTMNTRSQFGLVALSSVNDYETGIIKKHELTRPDKEQDRIQHILTTGAQTGNVFLAYKDVAEINKIVNEWIQTHKPEYDFIADDKIQHTVWVIQHSKTIQTLSRLFAEQVPHTYIADGHHRAASAAKVHQILKTKASAYFLTTLFPASQLNIMAYHRVVKDLNGYSPESFLQALSAYFICEPVAYPFEPTTIHEFGMYLDKQWYRLIAKKGSYTEDNIGILDVSILQNNVLSNLLNIADVRTNKRIDFIGGIHGVQALEEKINSGEMAVAFSLYPVSIEQLFTVADNNEMMPPKSTWFEPKLRDGLLTYLINETL